jgi:hypothetical protein
MDYLKMTAPCGLDCFNCVFYLAEDNSEAMDQLEKMSKEYNVPTSVMHCSGCRNQDGKIPLQKHVFGEDHYCAAFECIKQKEIDFCGQCEQFPCNHLHPYADQANVLPHNIKIFNLCLINKMGLEKWAKTKAHEVRNDYFNKLWALSGKESTQS